MSEFENIKSTILKNINRLCAHCVNGVEHDCPMQKISAQISGIKGIPLIVNDEFKGIIIR